MGRDQRLPTQKQNVPIVLARCATRQPPKPSPPSHCTRLVSLPKSPSRRQRHLVTGLRSAVATIRDVLRNHVIVVVVVVVVMGLGVACFHGLGTRGREGWTSSRLDLSGIRNGGSDHIARSVVLVDGEENDTHGGGACLPHDLLRRSPDVARVSGADVHSTIDTRNLLADVHLTDADTTSGYVIDSVKDLDDVLSATLSRLGLAGGTRRCRTLSLVGGRGSAATAFVSLALAMASTMASTTTTTPLVVVVVVDAASVHCRCARVEVGSLVCEFVYVCGRVCMRAWACEMCVRRVGGKTWLGWTSQFYLCLASGRSCGLRLATIAGRQL